MAGIDNYPRKMNCCFLLFFRVDINKDRKISAKEMQRWIMEKTEEHFQEAVEENKMHFRAVDPDGDGRRAVFILPFTSTWFVT